MLVMVHDGAFLKTYDWSYERGLLDNDPQNKKKYNSLNFGQLVYS